MRHTANGALATLGALRKSADAVAGADTATAITGAVYRTTAAAGALALVELNLPQ